MGPSDDRCNLDLSYLIFFGILWIHMLKYTFESHKFELSSVSNNKKKKYRQFKRWCVY